MNAIEAMDSVADHSRVLRVSSYITQESSDVLVPFEDSGTGIKEMDNEGIFEPFFTSKTDGMGIGLTICRSIIESDHGSLKAFTNSPSGIIFQVTLATDQR
jgi:C4-dicarboxylate-specific signal transduction histidine kinase